MSRSVPVARRNLTGQRARLAMSVGGVGLALLLVLTLNAVFAGVTRQVTAYVDHSGADVIVAQRGVTTMHMSNSSLPLATVQRVRRVPGVAGVAPILYRSVVLKTGQGQAYTYLIGFRGKGGPWGAVEGGRVPPPGGVVLDRQVATRLGVGLGDGITIAGRTVRVTGLMSGTTSIVSSVSFLDFATFAHAAGAMRSASYLLVRARPGISAARLATALQAALPDASVQTRAQFSSAERHTVGDMSTSLIAGLTLVGFVIGVAVAGLSLYTATVVRVREYAVLRAIGLTARALYLVVLRQALVVVGVGLLVGLALLGVVSLLIGAFAPQVTVVVTAGDLAQAAVITLVIGLIASLFPVGRIVRTAPAAVFRS